MLVVHERVYRFFLKYRYAKSTHPQLTPHKNLKIKYGDKQQLSPEDNYRSALDAAGVKLTHAIIGALLYYVHTVEKKLLVALSAIGAQQVAANKTTADAIKHLLDYVDTYPNDGIVYRASDMFLPAHSDAAFYNKSKYPHLFI